MLENGLEICNCKKKNCVRYGKCEECLEHHKNSKSLPLPYCKRIKRSVLDKILGRDTE